MTSGTHKSIQRAAYQENRERAMLRKICGDSPRMELPEKKWSVKVLLALLFAAGLWTYEVGRIMGAW